MKNIIHKTGTQFLLLFAAIVLITACKKNNESLAPQRLFKSSDIKITAGETSATLKWTAPLLSSGQALKYTVDFSTDANFSTIAYSKVVDTTGITVTEDNLAVRKAYYARIKANAFEDQPESKYVVSATFTMTGIQLFLPVRDPEVRESSVVLRYKTTEPTLSRIVLTPATGTVVTTTLSASDITAGLKSISGLTGGKLYTAELFAGTKSKGIVTFTTLAVTNYTTIISPADDLSATIAAAANGAVIGLNPGTYTLSTTLTTFITAKSITLKGTAGDPTTTKVIFKEIDLEGTGAGITLSGIEFDGTSTGALYFLNFIGSQATNGAAATFTNVVVDNCIVHGAATAFLRADRGTAANDHKITNITVSNSVVYDCGGNGAATYYTFNLNKIQFGSLTVNKSTFFNCGAGLVTASTVTSLVPTVTITYSTFNAFGSNAKYAFLDANTNPVLFTMQNNIIANTPRASTVAAAAVRSTGTGSVTTFSNNNTFGLVTSVGGATAVTLPTGTANQTVDLGWTLSTTNFTLPVGSALRTASSAGTALGDPRWTY